MVCARAEQQARKCDVNSWDLLNILHVTSGDGFNPVILS